MPYSIERGENFTHLKEDFKKDTGLDANSNLSLYIPYCSYKALEVIAVNAYVLQKNSATQLKDISDQLKKG